MTVSENLSKAISITFTRFPQNLLVPDVDNIISFQAINYFNNKEKFKFDIKGENLTVMNSDELEEEIHFDPGETKNFDVKLSPTLNGYGKLSMNVNWLKRVEYTVKVKKVRAQVSKRKSKKILGKYSIKFSKESYEFKPENFILEFSFKELKQAEKQLDMKRKKYNEYLNRKQAWEQKKSQGIVESEPIPEVLLEDIDKDMSLLARGYLSNKDPMKALELALGISDENYKINLYYNLIRAFAFLDLDGTIEMIKNLTKNEKRTELIKYIAFDQIKLDPEQAPRIAFLIEDLSIREQLVMDLIGKIIETEPNIALKISQLITDELMRIKIQLNVIRIIYEKEKLKAIEILKNIINNFEKSSKLNLAENKYKNLGYEYYRDTINLLAEIDSTQTADNLLIGFNLREVKDKVAEDLFNIIYEMVDETRIKFDPYPVFSQYYLFNTYVSNINEDLKNFSIIGGNVSNNILLKDFNIKVVLLSLFSFNFSIFPLLDRTYSDLKFNHNKSIAYFIFPSKKNLNETELRSFKTTLNQFGLVSNLSNTTNEILILNLDFIPYVGKPTIILTSDSEITEKVRAKVSNILGNNVMIKINEPLFKGGKTEELLRQIFSGNNFKFVNLIMSYEFINNYDMFKTFTLSLI
ncbi:MAG: hypothetical protein ACFFDK_15630 [Promethearchaeota archaeon]